MPVYKVTVEAVKSGLFGPTRISTVELYKAKNALEAKKMAEAEMEVEKRKHGGLPYGVIMLIKDVEKME